MLNQTHCFFVVFMSVIAAGCPTSSETTEATSSETTEADGPGTTTTPLDSSSAATTSIAEGSTSPETTSGSTSSSGGSPVDPCPPGIGVDWPRLGAYLMLATEEDFTILGPQDLSCSIDRALDSAELDALPPVGTAGALELTCEVPGGEGSSAVYVGTSLPEAVPSLMALVGLQDVSVLFHYAGPLRGKIDIGIDTIAFGIRDEVGPLLISQAISCDGPFLSPDVACDFLFPPFMVSPTWSDPLPEPRLAPVGCGTRSWENNQLPPLETYDMSRLAVRFETDAGVVNALDHHQTPLSIEGDTYEFFAIEALGEIEDPAVVPGMNSYDGSIRFLIIRAP